MPRDFLPASEGEFELWLSNFTDRLSAIGTPDGYGTTADERTALAEAADLWTATRDSAEAAAASTRSITTAKRQARRDLVNLIRPLVRRMHAHPAMTDAIRAQFGLSLAEPSAAPIASTITPDAAPLLRLDFGTRGQITVHFGPNPADGSRNGLPAGATGAVLQARVVTLTEGDLPTGLTTTWQWLDNATRSPYTHVVNPTTVTVIAYRVAYTYTRTRRGPWSEASQAACTPAT